MATIRLWLDDLFAPPDESWMWAKTSEEAMQILCAHSVSEIALDFDLGGGDTSEQIAKYIEEGAYLGTVPRMKWRIISNSSVGYVRLMIALRRADEYWEEKETD